MLNEELVEGADGVGVLRVDHQDVALRLDRAVGLLQLLLEEAGALAQEGDALLVGLGRVGLRAVEREQVVPRFAALVHRLEGDEGVVVRRVEGERAGVERRRLHQVLDALVVELARDEGELRGLLVVGADVLEHLAIDLGEAVPALEHAREARERLPRALVARVLPEEARVGLERPVEVLEVVLVDLPEAGEVRLALLEVALGREARLDAGGDLRPVHLLEEDGLEDLRRVRAVVLVLHELLERLDGGLVLDVEHQRLAELLRRRPRVLELLELRDAEAMPELDGLADAVLEHALVVTGEIRPALRAPVEALEPLVGLARLASR